MLHNPDDYPNPEVFNPDRFIGKDGYIEPSVRDPSAIAFGFGRRWVPIHPRIYMHTFTLASTSICPGRYFSQNTLAIFIASVLHSFRISAGVDATGQPVELNSEMGGSLIACVSRSIS